MKLYSSDSKHIHFKENIITYVPDPTLISNKKYTSYVSFIYRQRLGVKDPGEVYIVYKDNIDITYAVPFKLNDKNIPVYSLSLIHI